VTANDLQPTRLPEVDQSVSIDDLVALAGQAADILDQIRDAMLEPYPRKKAPMFTSASLAGLCGIDKQRLKYLTTKGDLPAGTSKGSGRAKEFTLAEAIQWVQATTKRALRPEGARGRVYAVANFKGGVTKTTTTIACAQALTLRGRKVLVIDCDPQGSATQLCGFAPETEVPENQTLLPLFYGDESTVGYAIRPTYWHNLDLIPATTYLSDAEFEVPAKLLSDRKFEFWDILNKGLKSHLSEYDVVLIDTPPALSQITTNALVVLMTKVKSTDLSRAVQEWLTKAYGSRVLPISIPESSVQVGAAAMLSTVYDVAKSDVSSSAYARIREPFDRLAEYLDSQLVKAWAKGGE
jgi:chromosome partitioning protein